MSQINSVSFYMKRTLSRPTFLITVSVYSPTAYNSAPNVGAILGSKSIAYDDVGETEGWVTWTFDTPITVTLAGYYGILIGMESPTGDNYSWAHLYWSYPTDWSAATGSTPYAGTECGYQHNGSHWSSSYPIAYKLTCVGIPSNSAETVGYLYTEGDCIPGLGVRSYLSSDATLGKASNPSPANGATNVSLNTNTLSWTAGEGATGYNVYLSWWGGTTTLTTTGTSITLSDWVPLYADRFGYAETYTWRIDSTREGEDATTGDTWSFTTRSFDRVWPTARDTSGNITITDVAYYTGENFICGNTARLVAASGNAIWYEGVDSA